MRYVLVAAALIAGLAVGYLVGYNTAPGNCYLPPDEYGSLEEVPDGIGVFPMCEDVRPDLARPRR